MVTFRAYREGSFIREWTIRDEKELKSVAAWIQRQKAEFPGTETEVRLIGRRPSYRPRIKWGESVRRASVSGDYDLAARYTKYR